MRKLTLSQLLFPSLNSNPLTDVARYVIIAFIKMCVVESILCLIEFLYILTPCTFPFHHNVLLFCLVRSNSSENLQLHTCRLNRMDEGGVEILDNFGVPIPNYIQKNIYSFARIWTGFLNSKRRANNEEQGKMII